MATPQMTPPPPPPARKISPLIWILVAVVGLMFLAGVAVAVGGYLFVSKVKNMAGSPAGIVRMLASANPDVEVISTDEGSGKITLKDKKTGKIVTMNFDDVKNGKIVFQEDGKQAVTIETGKDGQGTLDIQSAEGKMHIGAGSTKVPAWVPAYPGSSAQGTYSAESDTEQTGHYVFTTKDGADKVSKYYADALKANGFTVTTISAGGNFVTAKTDGDKRSVAVTAAGDGGETSVTVTYSEKKQ